MHGTVHCASERRTFRLSAPPRRVSPTSGSLLQGSPQPVSQAGPFARNGLSLACNGCPFQSLHSRVNGPGLLLRSLTTSCAARSALRLRYRFRFAPVPAASSLLARYNSACRFHPPLLRPPLPFGAFTPLRIKAFSRFRRQSVRLPNSPESLSLPAAGPFSITAADQRSWVATFPEACCSSNLLEPHSLCSRSRLTSTIIVTNRPIFHMIYLHCFESVMERATRLSCV